MSLPVAPLAHPTDLSHDRTVHSHVRFFDGGKGVIYPLDTLRGFLALGFNIIVSVFAMFVIHGGFSYWTRKSWIPDPLFRLEIPLMHRAKHGSDTGTYTTSGEFDERKFNDIFNTYDEGNKGGLTYWEGLKMIRGNRMIMDPFGWFAALFEWTSSYLLIWPRGGIVTKEELRGIYDGSIFYKIAAREKRHPSKGLFGGWKKSNDDILVASQNSKFA